MIDNVVRNIQVLWKADTLIGKMWAEVLARRAGLLAFAALISVFGLGMANVSGWYALQPTVGPVWSAAIVAVTDFALGLIVLLVARRSGPGREMELALQVRNMAVAAIQADAGDLRASLDAFARELRDAKQTITGLARNPLDVAAQKLLIPVALSIIRGLRSKKQEA